MRLLLVETGVLMSVVTTELLMINKAVTSLRAGNTAAEEYDSAAIFQDQTLAKDSTGGLLT